jgi:hypothetical protein
MPLPPGREHELQRMNVLYEPTLKSLLEVIIVNVNLMLMFNFAFKASAVLVENISKL